MTTIPLEKQCRKCLEWKPTTSFGLWRKVCKSCIYAQARSWLEEKGSGDAREYQRLYKANNREKVRESDREWKRNHPEKNRANIKDWRRRNPAHVQALDNNRRARTKGNGGTYTAKEWRAMCEFYGNICLCCRKVKKLTVDHVIPISQGGSNAIHNLQPICKDCNNRKFTQITDYRPAGSVDTFLEWFYS